MLQPNGYVSLLYIVQCISKNSFFTTINIRQEQLIKFNFIITFILAKLLIWDEEKFDQNMYFVGWQKKYLQHFCLY